MVATGALILFQFELLVPLGLCQLDCTAYDWLLPVLLVQAFGQTAGLAVYAVRYLFSKIRSSGVECNFAFRPTCRPHEVAPSKSTWARYSHITGKRRRPVEEDCEGVCHQDGIIGLKAP